MNRRAALAALLAFLAVDCHAERAIFLMMGQSNAAGMGQDPPPAYADAERIFVYRNRGEWTPGAEPVDEPDGQADKVSRDERSGVGFGMAFAQRYLALHPDVAEVGLVPCAKGGSTIARWAAHWSRQSLYGSCLARAREAEREGRIAGVLWWQGEDENATTALTWGRSFSQVMRDFRADLGLPRLPVVYARLDGPVNTLAYQTVRAQQEGVNGFLATMVTTDGIEYPDQWHPDTAGYQEIGMRFAEAMP